MLNIPGEVPQVQINSQLKGDSAQERAWLYEQARLEGVLPRVVNPDSESVRGFDKKFRINKGSYISGGQYDTRIVDIGDGIGEEVEQLKK
jgi:hypothetical protein